MSFFKTVYYSFKFIKYHLTSKFWANIEIAAKIILKDDYESSFEEFISEAILDGYDYVESESGHQFSLYPVLDKGDGGRDLENLLSIVAGQQNRTTPVYSSVINIASFKKSIIAMLSQYDVNDFSWDFIDLVEEEYIDNKETYKLVIPGDIGVTGGANIVSKKTLMQIQQVCEKLSEEGFIVSIMYDSSLQISDYLITTTEEYKTLQEPHGILKIYKTSGSSKKSGGLFNRIN